MFYSQQTFNVSLISVILFTIFLVQIIENWGYISVSKLIGLVHQSLFDGPVTCQNHHLLWSKEDLKNWSICFVKLKTQCR